MRNVSRKLNSGLFKALAVVAAFALAGPAYANGMPAERVIDLKGTTNTRDIGGYLTDDLRAVRYGQIIRSEKLSRLTPEDFRKLEEIGLKTVIDLRSPQENEHAPTVWQGDNPPEFHHFPIGDAENDWFRAQRKLFRKRFNQEKALEHMVEGYRVIADESTGSYEQLMDVVLDESNWPILIHCNAGKDRTGIAVALIMEAIGVDREVIMEDYLLTNEVGRTNKKAELMAKQSKRDASLRSMRRATPAAAWVPIVGVHQDMLEAFYASVEEEYGSIDAYLEALGVNREARDELIASLTSAPPEVAMEQ